MNEWLILRNSTIIFPFASRARSEARVMSNHCQQPNATGKKSDMFLLISVSIALTQATHKNYHGLQHWMALPSPRGSNPTSPGLAPCRHIYYLLHPQIASEIKWKNQEREYEVVVKQQSYSLLEPWQLNPFLSSTITSLKSPVNYHIRKQIGVHWNSVTTHGRRTSSAWANHRSTRDSGRNEDSFLFR